jgi:hypothetical protein
MDEADLLRAARRVRDDLIEMPGISQAAILGQPARWKSRSRRTRCGCAISGSPSPTSARPSSARRSIFPAGQIQTDEGSLMIRSKGQAYVRGDFENIVIRNATAPR